MTHIGIRQGKHDPVLDMGALQTFATNVASAWGATGVTLTAYRRITKRTQVDAYVTFLAPSRMPQGAGGYHDTDKYGRPVSYCLASLGLEVVAHELAEMIVDPAGTRFLPGPSLRTHATVEYLVEVCDPVERKLEDFVRPPFYAHPKLDPGGYISWIEGNEWWQAFADGSGHVTFQNLGAAQQRTRAEKDRLAAEAGSQS